MDQILERHLLIINDKLIRQKYFAEANDVLQKIEQIEHKIRLYNSKDQRLFDQWYKLTFRKDQEAVDQVQTELRELAQFHNWVVATARMLDIELPQAYALMKEEKHKFENGSVEERQEIERARKAREDFILSEVQDKYRSDFEGFSQEQASEEIHRHLQDILTRLEDVILPEDHDPLFETEARVNRLSAVPDDELKYWLKDAEISFLLFDFSLSWGEESDHHAFFLKLWKLMNRKQKKSFSEVYSALTGLSLEELVDRIDRSEIKDDEDEENVLEREFLNKHRLGDDFLRQSPKEEENLKSLYRKLIRKLHPDVQPEEKSSLSGEWVKRVWGMVQNAYQQKDSKTLERLLNMTLLRLNDLNQLTLDEIRQARNWLQKDLDSLKRETRQMRKSPAWGFSQKKDYVSLTRRLKEDFELMLESLREQIEEIQSEHRLFEMLSMMEESSH